MSRGLRLLLVCCLLAAGTGAVRPLYARTITAAGLMRQDVWDAINAARDGDTVQLPAGTAEWIGGWNDGHGMKMKAIIIQGAGIDKTVICDHRTAEKNAGTPFDLRSVAGKPFRVTGITFDAKAATGPSGHGAGPLMSIGGSCKNYRIDHCAFKNAAHTLQISGATYGLIDHCWFGGDEAHGGNMQPVDFSGPGGDNYRLPLSLGTDQATFFEDNAVHIDAYAGTRHQRTGNNPWIAPNHCARLVIRHNQLVNSQLEIYAPGRNKQYGCQQCEIYDNVFSTDGDGLPQGSIFIASGIAMVFNNRVTGPRNCHYIRLSNHRAYYVMGNSPFGKADGTNPIDGNEIPAGQVGAGYPCMGQVGRASNLKGGKSFDPTPCYAWNNTYDGRPMLMAVSGQDKNEAAQIVEGRDFFNQAPPEGTYAAYVYPHPLQNDQAWDTLMKSAAAGTPASAASAEKP